MNKREIRNIRRQNEEEERLKRFAKGSNSNPDYSIPKCPSILRIETINLCNSNCTFCAYQYQTRPVKIMQDSLFRKVADQYTTLGGTAINFSPVVGEALLDKSLEKKVNYIKEFKQYTKLELFTNGILLTRDRFESLVDAGINQFNISMSGFSSSEYQRIYRNKNYTRVLKNLMSIAESDAIKNVSIVIRSRTDSLWAEHQPDYIKLKQLNTFPIVFEPNVVSWHKTIKQEDLTGHMFLVAGPRDQSKPCLVIWGGLTVLSDGNMTLCGCTDIDGKGLPLGNINSVPLDNYLRDGTWAKIRDSFYNGNPHEFCRGCDSYYPAN